MTTHLTDPDAHRAMRDVDAIADVYTARLTLPAFARILVATDGSAASAHALAWAQALERDARVWILNVVAQPGLVAGATAAMAGFVPPMTPQDANAEARAVIANAEAHFHGTRVEGIIGYGDPAHEIATLANDIKADLVIVGTHGRAGASRIVLGSVADAVRNKVKTSILLARAPPSGRTVLAPIDGSANATRAAGVATRLAARSGAPLAILHVLETVPPGQPANAQPASAPPEPAQIREIVASGDPAQQIVAQAKSLDASLIVMGARGFGRVRSLLMGSVSERVCKEATTSVLVVRGPAA